MRLFRPHILPLVFCLALSACASVQNYEAMLDTWMGAEESALVASWGVPDKTYKTDEGDKMLAYVSRRVVSFPATPSTCQTRIVDNTYAYTDCLGGMPPIMETRECETTFVIRAGKVVKWGHKGGDCRL